MELFNLRNVNGRNKRRKQTKEGRFKKEHLSSEIDKTEYDLPTVSEQKLDKVKEDIRIRLKNENRKNLILSILISFLVFYFLYYFLVK